MNVYVYVAIAVKPGHAPHYAVHATEDSASLGCVAAYLSQQEPSQEQTSLAMKIWKVVPSILFASTQLTTEHVDVDDKGRISYPSNTELHYQGVMVATFTENPRLKLELTFMPTANKLQELSNAN